MHAIYYVVRVVHRVYMRKMMVACSMSMWSVHASMAKYGCIMVAASMMLNPLLSGSIHSRLYGVGCTMAKCLSMWWLV